jgi:hypothetical protein
VPAISLRLPGNTSSQETDRAAGNVTFPLRLVNSAADAIIIDSSPPVSLLFLFRSPKKIRQFAHPTDPFSLPHGGRIVGFFAATGRRANPLRRQPRPEPLCLYFIDFELRKGPEELKEHVDLHLVVVPRRNPPRRRRYRRGPPPRLTSATPPPSPCPANEPRLLGASGEDHAVPRSPVIRRWARHRCAPARPAAPLDVGQLDQDPQLG